MILFYIYPVCLPIHVSTSFYLTLEMGNKLLHISNMNKGNNSSRFSRNSTASPLEFLAIFQEMFRIVLVVVVTLSQ